MVRYSNKGLTKLKDILSGTTTLRISGAIEEHTDKLTMILTKLNVLADKNMTDTLMTFVPETKTILLGTKEKDATDLDIADTFAYFECTPYEEPDNTRSSRKSDVIFVEPFGELYVYNKTLDVYVANDGSRLDPKVVTKYKKYFMKKEVIAKYMPDLHKLNKTATAKFKKSLKALGLEGLEVGSKVRIIPYDILRTKHKEIFIDIDENDVEVVLDAPRTGKEISCLSGLGYTKLSAMYYDNKVGVVEDIDEVYGILSINIDGTTSHSKFYDEDGTINDSTELSVVFNTQMVELIKE